MWKSLKIFLLVICGVVGLAAGWVQWRSYRVSSVGHYYGKENWAGFFCARGKAVVGIGREPIAAVVKWDYYERPVKKGKDDLDHAERLRGVGRMGFGYYQNASPREYFLMAPLWVIWVAMALPILIFIWRKVRKSFRKGANLCEGCGYDLRGSGGRCPECGREARAGDASVVYNS